MSSGLYVVICLVVPAAWGALAYLAFGAIDRRRRERSDRPPPIDYYI